MNGMWVNPAGPAGGRNVVCLSVRPSVSLAALRGFGSEHEPGIPWAPPFPSSPSLPGGAPYAWRSDPSPYDRFVNETSHDQPPLSLSLEAAWTRCQSPPAENRPPRPSRPRGALSASPLPRNSARGGVWGVHVSHAVHVCARPRVRAPCVCSLWLGRRLKYNEGPKIFIALRNQWPNGYLRKRYFCQSTEPV